MDINKIIYIFLIISIIFNLYNYLLNDLGIVFTYLLNQNILSNIKISGMNKII